MTIVDLNKAPYHDDYNPNKNHSHILAVPGRVEQAREFTQMQTMIYDYLQRLSDALLVNGAIISGMSFNKTGNTLTVDDGKVYMNGKIHNFSKQQVTLSNTGEEIVGVRLVESIVTENEDISLLDPTTSTGNYGQPGSHRIKNEIVLTVNSPDASMLYDFYDGDLQSEIPRPQFDGMSDLLAKRTYDESGNYRVRGLDLFVEAHDALNMKVIVEAGTAYVLGYQVIKPTPVKTIIPMSRDFRSVIGEPKQYTTGTSKYLLNNVPSKAITQVTGYVQVTQNVTRGSTPNGIDYLANTPVVDIRSVTAGGTTYIRGTDFQLTNDGIDWSLSGKEPTTGTSYSVVYWFNKTFVQGSDFKHFQEIGEFGDTKDYVQWISGDKPANSTTFYINYDFYLARMDLVSIDKKGDIVVQQGQSDIPRNVKAPVNSNADLLPLGVIYLPPNTGVGTAISNTTTRLEMSQIQKMAQRVQDLEYNQAITALDREAIEGEVSTDLRGIFSDSFRSTVRADLTHGAFNVMYDLELGNIMLPLQNTQVRDMTIANPNNVKKFFRMTTAPMREVVAINQPFSTTTMLVNPYLAFNAMGIMALKPQVDNWIEESFINIEETKFEARNFWRWWGHPEYLHRVEDLFGLEIVEGAPVGTKVADWHPVWKPGVNQTATAIKTEKSKSILNEAITHMRQIDIEIHATNLQPSTDKLECTFDGVRVAMTPMSGYLAGSSAGTMRASSTGEIKAKIRVPQGIRTGTREVKIFNSSNTASTAFTSIGTKTTTTNKIITTRISMTAVDPLAQTFQFEKDTTLTSIGAYFSAKDNTHNVLVQIRNVVNGYPGTTILAETVLTPSLVKISENASVETKITFTDPVLCSAGEQYSMVFLTDSDVHAMYVADLGETDITTKQKILRQPYLAGMLFSSSNGLAWTAHQSKNLKFKVYKANFNSSTTVDFGEQTSMSADRLLLIVDTIVPVGTSCLWQVSLDSAPYQAINEYFDMDLIKVANSVRLRALLTTNGDMSPIISDDSIKIIGFTTALSGSYIGRNVELVDSIESVKQTFEAKIPNGCSVIPQFSYDNGASWKNSTVVSTTPISSEFTRYNCEASVPLSANATNYRARLNITSNSPILRPVARKFINIMK